MLTEESEKTLLKNAQQAEKLCEWSNALKLYNQAAESYLSREMVDEAAQTYKKLGYTKLYSAFTGETKEEVTALKHESIKYFEKAKMLFNQSHNKFGVMECKVGVFLIKLDFVTSFTEVKNIVDKASDLLLQLIDYYNRKNDKENLASAFVHLARLALSPSPKPLMERNKIFQKGWDYAIEAWKISKEIGNSRILTKSLYLGLFLQAAQIRFQEYRWDAHWKEIFRAGLFKWQETLKYVEKKDDYHSQMMAYLYNGSYNCFFGFHFIEDEEKQKEFIDNGLTYLKKALDLARRINDKYHILESLIFINFWAIFGGKLDYLQKRLMANLSEIEELGKKFPGFFENYSFSFSANIVSVYSQVARWSFFNQAQRIEFAEKGIVYGENYLKMFFGDELDQNQIYSGLVSSYSQLALLTSDANKRDLYLQKMLGYADKAFEFGKKAKGGFIRAFGYLAKYNAYKTLADLAKNEKEKISSLTVAIEAAKNHIELSVESRTGKITSQLRTGLLLEELGILSQNKTILQNAKENFLKIINENIERGYKSYAANAYQYVARIEDRIGNHMSSAKNYEKAREIYEESLKNLGYKPLITRIKEKIHYSTAWNLIEKAKVRHKGENHLKAKEFYENASDILKNIPRYNFEAQYYSAWGFLEEAEHLSKQEKQKEAIDRYNLTIKAFENTVKTLTKASELTKEQPEKERIEKLEKVAKIRINYCSARINLEEARILGKTGDHSTAADKYAMAASVFRSVCTRYKLEKEKKELEAIYYLCRAWESMELAEKFNEPERFEEAANLFTKASNLFADTKLKLLASGNSAFCQALEYGSKFDESVETRIKTDLYPRVKRMLRQAATSYEKGGFENRADGAQATSIYFDAAWYIIRADEETDLQEKSNLLGIGAKYLKSAMELYVKAGYRDKEKEVQDRLNRIEKEESILFSALSTLKEPSLSRSTTGIIAPSCPIESSQSPRLGEARAFTEEKRRVAIERTQKKKYNLVYKDLLEESPKIQRRECKVGIAQIGVSGTGNIMNEFYEMSHSGLLNTKENKLKEIRSIVNSMTERAHNEGVDVLLFPEMAIDLNYGEFLQDIADLAKYYNMYIIPGSFHDHKTKRNISMVFGPEGILWEQEKHIPAVISIGAGNQFKEGIEVSSLPRKTIICNTEYGRIAIVICRDFLDMDLRVELKNFEPPIDIILNPAFTPVTADFKAAHFDARRSIYAYSFFANIGEFGESLIYTPEKDRTKRIIPAKKESLIFKDIDLFKLRSERKKWEKKQNKERLFIQSTR